MNRQRALFAGTAGGVVHLALVGGLYASLYGPELFGYSTTTASFARFDPFTAYVVVGAFLLGAVPAVLLVEWRLVTPTLTVVASALGSLVLLSPGGVERMPDAAGPPPGLAFHFALWVVPVLVACVLGGIEYLVRNLERIQTDPDRTRAE